MKKTIVLISALLLFSFVPAFADGCITGPTSGQGCETSVTLEGLSLLWNKAQALCKDLISSGKEAKTTSGSGYVPPVKPSEGKPKPDSKKVAPAKKDGKDNQKETKTFKPSYHPAGEQMRQINVKPANMQSLRNQIFRSAYNAVPIK